MKLLSEHLPPVTADPPFTPNLPTEACGLKLLLSTESPIVFYVMTVAREMLTEQTRSRCVDSGVIQGMESNTRAAVAVWL